MSVDFEWNEDKNEDNQIKHGVSFYQAQQAFLDPSRLIVKDMQHSIDEQRYYCFGSVDNGILTVRFTMRAHKIRIIGAGYWRKGKKLYEQERN